MCSTSKKKRLGRGLGERESLWRRVVVSPCLQQSGRLDYNKVVAGRCHCRLVILFSFLWSLDAIYKQVLKELRRVTNGRDRQASACDGLLCFLVETLSKNRLSGGDGECARWLIGRPE